MSKELFCHYYSSTEKEIHKTDVQHCENCGVPVCSSCRINGFCVECDRLRGDEIKLTLRAQEMESFYDNCGRFGL